MTGMPRQRFDYLWSALRWSHQPKKRPEGMTHAEHRWMLVDDMVKFLTNIVKSTSFLWNGFVLMSPYHGGMDSVAHGLKLDC